MRIGKSHDFHIPGRRLLWCCRRGEFAIEEISLFNPRGTNNQGSRDNQIQESSFQLARGIIADIM